MSNMQEHSGVARALFVFVAALPYVIFRIGYFLVTLPLRMRRMKRHRRLPKHIHFQRVRASVLSVHEMVECLHELNQRDGPQVPKKSPSMFDLFEALWDEGMSSQWKIPTVSEIMTVREEMLIDIKNEGLYTTPLRIWAISEDTHMFVAFNLSLGNFENATPKDTLALFAGKAPDSHERCYGYAVSVAPIDSTSTMPP